MQRIYWIIDIFLLNPRKTKTCKLLVIHLLRKNNITPQKYKKDRFRNENGLFSGCGGRIRTNGLRVMSSVKGVFYRIFMFWKLLILQAFLKLSYFFVYYQNSTFRNGVEFLLNSKVPFIGHHYNPRACAKWPPYLYIFHIGKYIYYAYMYILYYALYISLEYIARRVICCLPGRYAHHLHGNKGQKAQNSVLLFFRACKKRPCPLFFCPLPCQISKTALEALRIVYIALWEARTLFPLPRGTYIPSPLHHLSTIHPRARAGSI